MQSILKLININQILYLSLFKNYKMRRENITGAVVASMIMSTSITAFASNSKTPVNNTSVTQHQSKNNGLQTKLDSLVEAGTLSSDGATAIKEVLQTKDINKHQKTDKFKSSEDRANMIKTKLNLLVTSMAITAVEETAVIESLTSSK